MKKISGIFLLTCIMTLFFSTHIYAFNSPDGGQVNHYSSDEVFIKHHYQQQFHMLLLSDNGNLYTWGPVQALSDEYDMATNGVLYSNGNLIVRNDDNSYHLERQEFEVPTAIASKIVDFGFLDTGVYAGQTIYYLTENNKLYFLQNNSVELIMEDVINIFDGESYIFAINSMGEVWEISYPMGERNVTNIGKINIDTSHIKKFEAVYEDNYIKAEVLFDNGEFWVYNFTDGSEEFLLTNIDSFKHYAGYNSGRVWEYDLAVTNDKWLMCKGIDPVTGEEYMEYTQLADNVRAFDIVRLHEEYPTEDDYILTVLKNDNTLWVLGKNDILRLGSFENVETGKLTKVDENVRDYWIESSAYMGVPRGTANYILKTDGTLWGNGNNVMPEFAAKEDDHCLIADNVERFNAYGWCGNGLRENLQSGIIMLKQDSTLEILGKTFGLSPENADAPVCIFTDFSKGIVNKDLSDENYRNKIISAETSDISKNINDTYDTPYDLYLFLASVLAIFLIIYIYIGIKTKNKNL